MGSRARIYIFSYVHACMFDGVNGRFEPVRAGEPRGKDTLNGATDWRDGWRGLVVNAPGLRGAERAETFAQLGHRARFELAHALARDAEHRADLFQRRRLAPTGSAGSRSSRSRASELPERGVDPGRAARCESSSSAKRRLGPRPIVGDAVAARLLGVDVGRVVERHVAAQGVMRRLDRLHARTRQHRRHAEAPSPASSGSALPPDRSSRQRRSRLEPDRSSAARRGWCRSEPSTSCAGCTPGCTRGSTTRRRW